jgi:hypothetical protein
MSSFNITCIGSRTGSIKLNGIGLELALLGVRPSVFNWYSNLVHFPGHFVRCCWYSINTLYKSSGCCAHQLLFPLTLPHNLSPVIILSSVIIFLPSSLCPVCCLSTDVSFPVGRSKTQSFIIISNIHFISILFTHFPLCSAVIVNGVIFFVLHNGTQIITLSAPTWLGVSGGKLH